MTVHRALDAGFTLIETLVALSILAITAVTLLGVTEGHVARVADLEKRAAAEWVAENRLAEMSLGLTPGSEPVLMLGYSFGLRTEIADTQDPDLQRVTLVAQDEKGAPVARITGFVLAPDGGRP